MGNEKHECKIVSEGERMIWPEKIKLCGTEFDFEVKDVPATGLPISEWGEYDGCKLSIDIYVNGQSYHDLDTLIHEVLHAGCDIGLDLGKDEAKEHKRIAAISRFMSQFLLDNELIEWEREQPDVRDNGDQETEESIKNVLEAVDYVVGEKVGDGKNDEIKVRVVIEE